MVNPSVFVWGIVVETIKYEVIAINFVRSMEKLALASPLTKGFVRKWISLTSKDNET